jgi:cold shock protein
MQPAVRSRRETGRYVPGVAEPWTAGTVKVWHEDEGWGVLVSADVAGEVLAHFSNIRGGGYRLLTVGERVEFRYVEQEQDEYAFVATVIRRARV